jgi:hypothetical protein
MSRVASAMYGSPDVFGRWRGHGLRTDRAAYLLLIARVRYRESCPSRQSLRGMGAENPEPSSQLGLNLQTWPRPRRGLRHSAGDSAHQLFRCHICQVARQPRRK